MKETRLLKQILKSEGVAVFERGVLFQQNEFNGEGYVIFATSDGRFFSYGFYRNKEYITESYFFPESALSELVRRMKI